MRLTLRTLLAYLDDTLEPAQAKAIGEKIAESPTAPALINRIKKVVRQRRLTVPPATGPGARLDANAVAEYIDSVLPADQLGAVEEVCLDDDLYLAEIASCHQILTVVLSEPSLVPPTARQRMYGIAKGPEAIPYRKAARETAPETELASAGANRDDADETLLLGMPVFSRLGPWYRRLAPVAVLLLLVGGLIAAIWKAIPPSPQLNGTRTDGLVALTDDASKEPAVKAAVKPGDSATAKPTPKPVVDKGVEPKTPLAPGKTADKGIEKTTPGAAENGSGKIGSGTVDKGPAQSPDGSGENPTDKNGSRTPGLPEKPGQPAAKRERKVVGKYQAPARPERGILLTRTDDQSPWKRLFPDNPVHSEDTLVSLPGYRSTVNVRDLELVLWGELPDDPFQVSILESVAVLHASPDVDLDLTLNYGRVAVANTRPSAKAKVRVRFLDQAWVVTLEPGSRMAVDRFGAPALDFNKEPGKSDPPVTAVALHVLKGQFDLQVGSTHHFMREPRGPARFLWDNLGGPEGPLPLDRLPPWADQEPSWRKDPNLSKAVADLDKRLSPTAAVDVVLTEIMAKEPDPARKILAIFSLGALGDLPNLVEALGDETQAGGRVTATVVLRHWLGQKPENDMTLYHLLAKKYKSAATAERVMDLLHDFSEAKRRQPDTYEQLLWCLKSDNLAIRHLAQLRLLTMPETKAIAPTIAYNPAGGIEQREQAYDKWKAIIPDGKLPSKTREPKPAGKKPMPGPK